MTFAIGVDLGATKIASALTSRGGEVLSARQAPTVPEQGAAAVLDRIAAEVTALAAQAPAQVSGIGIGTPGQVNPNQGLVHYATNLGWDELALRDGVASRLKDRWPVWIEKDTNAGALGEYMFGAAAGCRNFVYLTVGSGLGAGVFANGALVTGATNNASELGHLSLDPNGRPCLCGSRGCAETVVSGAGLLAITRQKLAEGKLATALSDGETLTTTAIIGATRSGDEAALAAFAEVAQWLGIVMATCVAVLNPAQILVGGGLGIAASDLLLPGACAELKRRVPANSYQPIKISSSGLTNNALGAACLVWQGLDQVAGLDLERRPHAVKVTEVKSKVASQQ